MSKRNLTRAFSMLMALVLSLSLLPPTALAAEAGALDTSPVEEAQPMVDGLRAAQEDGLESQADSGVIYISSTGADSNSGSQSRPLASLSAAYASVQDGGTIVVLDDLDLDARVMFDEAKDISLTSPGGAVVTYISSVNIDNGTDGVFAVLDGTLSIENITIQLPEMRGTNGRPLYVGPHGSVTLGDGTVIANGYLAYGGGGVFVDGGSLTMEAGATIRDNYIANNTTCFGGGVLVANGGAFSMNGGEIRGNAIHTTQGYVSCGGGVAVQSDSVFCMTGGAIRDNDVDTNGGGVYFASGGTMTMAGDIEVSGNEAGEVTDNLYLADMDTHFALAGTVSGTVGLTCGEATYGVVVGIPDGYEITTLDEGAFVYDSGEYDIRLDGENLVLFWFTVPVDLDMEGVNSENAADETPVGQDYDTVLLPDEGYQLPDEIHIFVGGVELPDSDYTYDPETGTVHIPGEEVAGDIKITVKGDAQHTLTVIATNVSADVEEVVVIAKDTTVITLTAADRYALPIESGITIEGSCDHTYASGVLTLTNVASDVTVAIQGAEIYHTIYFDPGEGQCDMASKQITESQATYGPLPTTTRMGYTFSGWYAGEVLVTADTVNHLTDDLQLVARWDQKTNIHYEVRHWVEYVDSGVNPGYEGGQLQSMTHDGTPRKYYLFRTDSFENGIANGELSISGLALTTLGDGLIMDGMSASGANVYDVTMAPDGSSVYPLYYDRQTYTVTYDANGGTMDPKDTQASVHYGSLYGVLPAAARSGYTLMGWYTAPHGGIQVQADDIYSTAADQVLYAHWQPVGDTRYTVRHMLQLLHDNTVDYTKTPEHYELGRTDELTGTSDTAVDLYALAIPGYVPSPDNNYTITVQADGSAVAYLYYDRLATDVAYDSQGGTTVSFASRLYYGGTFAGLPADPTKVGHSFAGWYTAPDATAQRVTLGTAVNDINPDGLTALTLYARWTPRTYGLTLEAHGGTVNGQKTVTYGQPVGELPTATLAGYLFRAWFDEDGKLGQPEGKEITAETVVDTDTVIQVGADGGEMPKTLFAWYDPIQIDIAFDAAPGALPEGATGTLTMTYDKPFSTGGVFPVPVRTGYTFRAWRFADKAELVVSEICKLLAGTTVYADYAPNLYAVTLNVAGGDALASSKLIVTYDAAYGKIPTPTRTGYTFQGWYNASGEEVKEDTIVQITAPETLTAHWTANNYTVTFDPNGGKALAEGAKTMTATFDSPYGALPTPNRSGYRFTGWYTEASDGIVIQADTVVKLTGDTTLYAHWTAQSSGGGGGGGSSRPTEYTLTFQTNGGSKLAPVTATRNTKIKLEGYTTSRNGYVFAGWYLDKNFANEAGASVKLTGDMTLYAKWDADKGGDLLALLEREDHRAYLVGFEDGTIRPEANITRAEVAMIFWRLLTDDAHARYDTTENGFVDVPEGAWHNTAVSTLARIGILQGRGSGQFDPAAPVTRAEFAAIAARFSAHDYDGPDKFTDISQCWARSEINRAADMGWVQGDGSGAFVPDALMSRAETVTLINRVLGRLPADADALHSGMKTWPDNADPAAWYYLAIQEATTAHTYVRTADGHETWNTVL